MLCSCIGIPIYDTNKLIQIYIALLKFDFLFFLGFTVQFVVIVVDTKDIEFALTIAAIPVTVLILILAGYITRKESTVGMIAIIVSIVDTSTAEPTMADIS